VSIDVRTFDWKFVVSNSVSRRSEFEQEAGYPKDDGRFLDTSIRGLCTDENGKVHNIPKEIITSTVTDLG
jgi:hypothetical protein